MFQDGSVESISSTSWIASASARRAFSKESARVHTGKLANAFLSRRKSRTESCHHAAARINGIGVILEVQLMLTMLKRFKWFVRFPARAGLTLHQIAPIEQELDPNACPSAISGTFNSLFKVLFTFPSRYLFAIGLESIFSFR